MEIFGQVRISGIGAASRGHGGTWSGEDKMAMSGLQKVGTREVTSQMRIRRPGAASIIGKVTCRK